MDDSNLLRISSNDSSLPISCLTSDYGEYINDINDMTMPTPISPMKLNTSTQARSNTPIPRKKTRYHSNNITLRNSAPKSLHLMQSHRKQKLQNEDILPIKRPSSLRQNDFNALSLENKSYPFSFPLHHFSCGTTSTPSPPPLSPSFHHNIHNNDIVISMAEDTKLRRSISQYLIINEDHKKKRLSIHQRNQTMQPLPRKAVNIAPNTTTFQILADYPFANAMDQAMETGNASDDAVYRYKSRNIKDITASSSITSIQSQCDMLNKLMFDELHAIKLNQHQFSKQLHDLQKTQHLVTNTLHDLTTNVIAIRQKMCVNTPKVAQVMTSMPSTHTINEDYETDDGMNTPKTLITHDASSIIIHDTNCEDETNRTQRTHSHSVVDDDNKSDTFLDDAAIETMHSLFKQKMNESKSGKRDSNPFGHRQNLSDVFERNIDQFMLLLKSHEREKEKLEHEKMLFQVKLKDLQHKIDGLNIKGVTSESMTQNTTTASAQSETNKSTKSHDLLSPRHRNEFVSKTSFHSTESMLQFTSPRYSVTKSNTGKKSNEIILDHNNNNNAQNDECGDEKQMDEQNVCDLVDFGVEDESSDNQQEEGNESRSKGTVHEFVSKYHEKFGTNHRNHSHSNYTQTATATFIDPRGLSYRYLSSPAQSIDANMDEINVDLNDDLNDIETGQHHFYPPPTHNFNDNVQKYKMIALKQSKTDPPMKYDGTMNHDDDDDLMLRSGGNSSQSTNTTRTNTRTESRKNIMYNEDSNTRNLRINAQNITTQNIRSHTDNLTDTPISHAMSTPTTNTYVYHANAPRLIDIDNDPFGCALEDASCDGDGESLMIETINNAQKHLLKQQEEQQQLQSNTNESYDDTANPGTTAPGAQGGHSKRDTLTTLHTPMPHNVDSLCFDSSDRVQSMHIPSPKHHNNNIDRKHRSTIPHSSHAQQRVCRMTRIYHHTPPPHNNHHHNHHTHRNHHTIQTPPPPHKIHTPQAPVHHSSTASSQHTNTLNMHQTVSLTANAPYTTYHSNHTSSDRRRSGEDGTVNSVDDIQANKNGRKRRRKRQRMMQHKKHDAANGYNAAAAQEEQQQHVMNSARSYHSHARSDRSSMYQENNSNRHPHSQSVKNINRVITINRANSANSSCLKQHVANERNASSSVDTSALSRNLACSVSVISPKSETSSVDNNVSSNETSYYSNTVIQHNINNNNNDGARWRMNPKSNETNIDSSETSQEISSESKSESDSLPPNFTMPNIAEFEVNHMRSQRTPTTPKNILNNLLKLNRKVVKQASSRSIQTIRSFRDEKQQKQQRKQSTVSIHRKKWEQKQIKSKFYDSHSVSKPILSKKETYKTTKSDLTPRTSKLKKCNPSSKSRKKYKTRDSQRQTGKKCKNKIKHHHHHHQSGRNNDDEFMRNKNNHHEKLKRIQSNSPKTMNHHRRSRRESTQKIEKRGIVKKFKKVFEK